MQSVFFSDLEKNPPFCHVENLFRQHGTKDNLSHLFSVASKDQKFQKYYSNYQKN